MDTNEMKTRADSPNAFNTVRAAVLGRYIEAVMRYQKLAAETQHPVARELARLAELRLRLAEIGGEP